MGSVYLDPNATETAAWDHSAYTAIDDGVRAGTTPTGGTNEFVQDLDKSGNNTSTWGLEDYTSPGEPDTPSSNYWRLWWYKSGTSDVSLSNIEIRVNNVWQGTADSSGTHGTQTNWKYSQWDDTSVTVNSTITNMGFRMQTPAMSNGDEGPQIWAVYLELNYSGGTTVSIPGAVQSLYGNSHSIICPPWHDLK